MKIGIDIGNVIIGGGGVDTFFTEKYLETPEITDAYTSILALYRKHELHIISKCGVRTEEKSIEWLFVNGFFYAIKNHRIHFVRKRELKAYVAYGLGLDIFIDDRQDIYDSMKYVIKHPILFKSWEQTNSELKTIFEEQEKNNS